MALIDWENVVRKYPELRNSDDDDSTVVDDYHVPYAVAELESALSSKYATPFSDTNLTAQDLAVDLVYLRLQLGKDEKWDKVNERVAARIEALLSGSAGMIDEDGTVTTIDGVLTGGSTDINHSATFGPGGTDTAEISQTALDDEEAGRT